MAKLDDTIGEILQKLSEAVQNHGGEITTKTITTAGKIAQLVAINDWIVKPLIFIPVIIFFIIARKKIIEFMTNCEYKNDYVKTEAIEITEALSGIFVLGIGLIGMLVICFNVLSAITWAVALNPDYALAYQVYLKVFQTH